MATVSTAYPAQLGSRTAQRNPVSNIGGNAIDNDTGTIVSGGTIASTRHQSVSTKTLASERRPTGSQVIQSAEAGSIKANTDRNFAHQEAREFVIIGVTDELGNVATSVLKNSSSKRRRKFHWNVVDKATLVVTRGWDYESGQHPSLPSASSVAYPGKDGTTTTTGTVDKVTLETNDEPGRLSFHNGSNTIKTQGYAARHLG